MTELQKKTPIILRLSRHLVALLLLSVLNPYTLHSVEPFLYIASTFISPVLLSSILFSLYLLFFTEKAKLVWPKNFIVMSWGFFILLMIGYWQPYKFISNSQESHINNSLSHQQDFQKNLDQAKKGNAEAQFQVGEAYEDGKYDLDHIVLRDYEQAMYWYHLAAKQGHITAQQRIGNLYLFGRGVSQDYRQAAFWLQSPAENGDDISQLNLAAMYLHGHGVQQDFARAMYWYRLSAQQGNELAWYYIGLMHEKGYGVTKDRMEAEHWYKLAAKQGLKPAQEALERIQRH